MTNVLRKDIFESLINHSGNKMIDISGVIDEIILRTYFGRRSRGGGSKARIRMNGVGSVGDIPINGTELIFYIDRNKVENLSEGDMLDLRCKVKRLIPYEGIELNYVRIKQDKDDDDRMLEEWKLRGII